MTATTTRRTTPARKAHVRATQMRRRRRNRQLLRYLVPGALVAAVALVAIVATSGGSGGTGAPAPPGSVRVAATPRVDLLTAGSPIPDFEAPALAGGRVEWASYRGAPTVLAAWAPWCPHCQKELPVLARVIREFPGVRLVTVVTAVDAQPGPTAEGFMSEKGLSFPVAVDDAQGTLAAALGVTGFPTTY
jgi:peroxiredoxin